MSHTLDQQLNEKLRDAQLALYLAHAVPNDPTLEEYGLTHTLKTADDLYTHWLLDVLVSQAVPTSRVASAIASLQQYINGISMGLEPGYEIQGMTKTQLATWHDTLHTYSLWHANQQLRYFPSAYLNPELRSHKTSSFQQLENDINQCRIQSSSILPAVQSYLGRFEDIANLTTLNGYIDGNIDSLAESTYYFVGKSRAENTYYWRSLDMAKRLKYPSAEGMSHSKQDRPEASAWSDWQKVPLPASENIPDRSVRPVFFNNRLFIIWAQVIRPTPSLSETKLFSEFRYDESEQQYKERLDPFLKSRFSKISLNFIYQKYDGSWSMPQVCFDEYCTLKVNAAGINAATTTIATLDSSTRPPSLFLGLHIENGEGSWDKTSTELNRGFYQAARLDVQFGIQQLYSHGTPQDFIPYPENKRLAQRYGAIFAIHNKLNFNFHAPESQLSAIENFVNTPLETLPSLWDYDNKQSHIKNFTETSELRFNKTTSSLEIKSTIEKAFPKHQTLHFNSNNGTDKLGITLIVSFGSTNQNAIQLYKGSSLTLTQQEPVAAKVKKITLTNTRTKQTFEISLIDANDIHLEGKPITLNLEKIAINQDSFINLFNSYTDPHAISVEMTSTESGTPTLYLYFENLNASAYNRTYKHIILIPRDKQASPPLSIDRKTTVIIGESGASRRYLENTSLELRPEHSITAHVQIDPVSMRPSDETRQPAPTSFEQNKITLLHGVVTLEVEIESSKTFLLGYALKALDFTLDNNTKTIIPLAPKLTRVASNFSSAAECIDFSGSMIDYSDGSPSKGPRQPVRMNTGFAETLTKAASVSLETLFTLPQKEWSEPPLKKDDNQTYPLDFHGAHGKYYWELFLYLPWLIAYRLNMEQRYAEAQKWMHYLFNPGHKADINAETSEFWLLKALTVPISEPSYARDNPNDPDQIALSSPVHFRQALYQLYLDILINRGDAAYRQMTADSLAEAKLWYIRAKRLLGPRPVLTSIAPWTRITLEKLSAEVSSELRQMDTHTSQQEGARRAPSVSPTRDNQSPLTADTPYLRRPLNPGLTARWDKIDSRLHNLRHHLDLAGKPLQLALFATALPPLALLSRAAQGGNYGQVRPLPAQSVLAGHYRFQVMQAQAMLAVENLIQFGSTLLSLFERKEQTEQMAQQYAHAWDLSTMTVEHQAQILLVDDKNLSALQAGRRVVEARVNYFEKQLLEGINPGEARASREYQDSARLEVGAYAAQAAAGVVMMLPNIFGTSNGGMRLEGALHAVQATIQSASHEKRSSALHLDRTEQFNRRNQEWGHALEQARLELNQIDAQLEIYAEQSRVSRLQLRQTETALAQAKTSYEILSKRFCNAQLYQWLNSQLSTFYFQAFDITHSLCMSAQACWQYEQANWDRSFIQNTQWNNQYRGLVAGEALKLNLLNMSTAYLQHNKRGLEISKTVSLRQLFEKDPKSTVNKEWATMKESLLRDGWVDFELTQDMFEADYPGHYLRRIKSISVSLPATLGP